MVVSALYLHELRHLSKMPFLAPEAEQENLLIDDNSQGKKKAKQLDVAVMTAALLPLMF